MQMRCCSCLLVLVVELSSFLPGTATVSKSILHMALCLSTYSEAIHSTSILSLSLFEFVWCVDQIHRQFLNSPEHQFERRELGCSVNSGVVRERIRTYYLIRRDTKWTLKK